jgi:hypothetical protein
MKGLLPTRASRAWLVVALVGLVVVVLVLALRLAPRLSAGQDLIDTAGPALTDERVAGDRAGIDFISKYVDLADPLVTARSGGSVEISRLIALLTNKRRSPAQVAAILRREAPHTEALLRALPLSGVAREVPALTGYLSTKLNLSEEELAAELERSFPKLSQTLTALPSVTIGWNDIPGIAGLTRFDGTTAVKSVPQLRDYFSKDLVATVADDKDDFQAVAGHGGIGYIPNLLLVIGVVLLAFGVLQVRRSRDAPPGKPSWAVVVAVGVVVVGLVVVLQYFPRLNGADRVITGMKPAFAQARVVGDRAGIDMVHQTVLFGDPIVTKRGGAAAEVPELLAFVARRTNVKQADVLAALRKRAPRITAVLQAIPLSSVAAEVPHLLTFLGKTLKLSRAELLATLQRRTPRLAQSILAVRPVALRWNSVPGTGRLTRLDGTTPVRTMAVLEDYFNKDVIPVLETQGGNFRDLADPWPPVNYFPPLLLAIGALVVLYGLLMMRFATRQPKKH